MPACALLLLYCLVDQIDIAYVHGVTAFILSTVTLDSYVCVCVCVCVCVTEREG